MTLFFYTLLFYVAQPFIWLRLLWRAKSQPEYLTHVRERYGFYPPFLTQTAKPLIWLHVVSVGETRAAEPLIRALLTNYPQHALLLTHMTPTGRQTGKELIEKLSKDLANAENRLMQAYLPYDLLGACARFLRHFSPKIGLLMETELWPNLIHRANRCAVPVLLVNARLSEKSAQGYARIPKIIRPTLRSLSAILAQSAADKERLQHLGGKNVHVCGNIKFDVTPNVDKLSEGKKWREKIGNRAIFLAASTREGEEVLIVDAWQNLKVNNTLLVIVPRHPQRFEAVFALLQERGVNVCRRSNNEFPTKDTQIWLGDSMGEMVAYFSAAHLALIGGTLLPFGGQNLIEACACGCPVLLGEHTFNFAEASKDALAENAALRVKNAEDAFTLSAQLLEDGASLEKHQQAAFRFAQKHQGATARTMNLIAEFL